MSLTARTVVRRLAHRNIDWYVIQLYNIDAMTMVGYQPLGCFEFNP